MLSQSITSSEALVAFWQLTEEWLFPCMAAHVGSQCVGRCLYYSWSSTAFPLAGIAFFTFADVVFMNVFD